MNIECWEEEYNEKKSERTIEFNSKREKMKSGRLKRKERFKIHKITPIFLTKSFKLIETIII